MCSDRSLCGAIALAVATKRAACADVVAAGKGTNAFPSTAQWKGPAVVMFAPVLSTDDEIGVGGADGGVVTNLAAVVFSWQQARGFPQINRPDHRHNEECNLMYNAICKTAFELPILND